MINFLNTEGDCTYFRRPQLTIEYVAEGPKDLYEVTSIFCAYMQGKEPPSAQYAGWIRVAMDAIPRKRGKSNAWEMVGCKVEGEWRLYRR